MNIERIIGLWEAWDSTGSPEGPDSPITDIVVLDKILKEDPYNTCANYLVARHYIGLFDKEVREIQRLNLESSLLEAVDEEAQEKIKDLQSEIETYQSSISCYASIASSRLYIVRSNILGEVKEENRITDSKLEGFNKHVRETLTKLYLFLKDYSSALPLLEITVESDKPYLKKPTKENHKNLADLLNAIISYNSELSGEEDKEYHISQDVNTNYTCALHYEHENPELACRYLEQIFKNLKGNEERIRARYKVVPGETNLKVETSLKNIENVIEKCNVVYERIVFKMVDDFIKKSDIEEKDEDWEKTGTTDEIKPRKINIPSSMLAQLIRVSNNSRKINNYSARLRYLNLCHLAGNYEDVERSAEAILTSLPPKEIVAKTKFIRMASYFVHVKLEQAYSCAEELKGNPYLENSERSYVNAMRALGNAEKGKTRRAKVILFGSPWLRKKYEPNKREYLILRNFLVRRLKK